MATRSVSSNRGHRAGQCAPEVPRTRIRARGDLLEQCPRPAAGRQMMLQVEQGGQQLTSESPVHPLRTDASSGVGNSSARTVDAHVPREWEGPASEALREGWSEAEVCAEEVAAPRKPLRGDSPREPVAPSRGNCQQERRKAPSGSSYRQGRRKAPSRGNCRQGNRTAPSGSNSTAQSKAPSGGATCRTSSIGTSNLLNRQHREADVFANNGAKWAGVEGVRGSNLACFLKNFVSNYIVIFLMMLFRVHL